jgi:hypothetical protein
MQLHEEYGNHWSKISVHMPTRADNMIKNRWYSILAKKSKEDVVKSAEEYRNSPESVLARRGQSLPSVRFASQFGEPMMPLPVLDRTRQNESNIWTPIDTLTPFQIPASPGGFAMISPLAPSASPFALTPPFQKMVSMFSPSAPDFARNDLFSPMKGSHSSLSENRAELLNLIDNQ